MNYLVMQIHQTKPYSIQKLLIRGLSLYVVLLAKLVINIENKQIECVLDKLPVQVLAE